jgi:hypothetical protein
MVYILYMYTKINKAYLDRYPFSRGGEDFAAVDEGLERP